MKHQLHARHGAVAAERAEWALRGAWDTLSVAADYDGLHFDARQVEQLLHEFCVRLLTTGDEYDPLRLANLLRLAEPRLRAPIPVGAAA